MKYVIKSVWRPLLIMCVYFKQMLFQLICAFWDFFFIINQKIMLYVNGKCQLWETNISFFA